jgi:hypothetical protein
MYISLVAGTGVSTSHHSGKDLALSQRVKMIVIITSKRVFALWLACFIVANCDGDDRFLLDAKINGHRAQLCFDTGADGFGLLRESAQRFGLTSTNVAFAPGGITNEITETCILALQGSKCKAWFWLFDGPEGIPATFDGIIGWPALRNNVIFIDADNGRLDFPYESPRKISKWTQFLLVTNSDMLGLETRMQDGTRGAIWIDTGAEAGVEIPPRRWQVWKKENSRQPITFRTAFRPGEGVAVVEESWANQIAVGPLVLTNVPVMEMLPYEVESSRSNSEAVLGIYALRSLKLIVDGPHGVAYVDSKKARHVNMEDDNRLGAAFLPQHSSSDLLEYRARVAEDSPAQEAGVQNGDILVRVNDQDVSGPNAGVLVPNGGDWMSMPAGTKIRLTLRRGGAITNTTATLREMLPPSRIITQ